MLHESTGIFLIGGAALLAAALWWLADWHSTRHVRRELAARSARGFAVIQREK